MRTQDAASSCLAAPRWLTVLSAAALSSSVAACSDGGEPPASDQRGGEGPLFATSLRVTAPTQEGLGEVGYLVAAPALEEGAVLSPDQGIEGSSVGPYGLDGFPAVWLDRANASGEPIIERWDLSGDAFVAPNLERTMSLANLTNYFNYAFGTFVSSELGLLSINEEQPEVVRWDPSAMEILGTLPLDFFPRRYKVRPDGTIIAGGYREVYDDNDDELLLEAGLDAAVLSPDATDVIGQDVWEDVMNANPTEGMASDGTTFFTAFPGVNADGEVDPQGGCLIRILPEATSFDREFGCLPLVDLVEGARADGLFVNYVHVLGSWAVLKVVREDEAIGEINRFYRWDLESDQAEPLGEQEFGILSSFLEVDGRFFFSDDSAVQAVSSCVTYDEDDMQIVDEDCVDEARADAVTQFYEITETAIEPAFTVPAAAWIWKLLRVR